MSKTIYEKIPLVKMVLSETKDYFSYCDFYAKWENMTPREKRKMTTAPKEGMPHVPSALLDTFIKGIYLYYMYVCICFVLLLIFLKNLYVLELKDFS